MWEKKETQIVNTLRAFVKMLILKFINLGGNMRNKTRILILLMVSLLMIENASFPIGALNESKEGALGSTNSRQTISSQYFEFQDSNYTSLSEDEAFATSLFLHLEYKMLQNITLLTITITECLAIKCCRTIMEQMSTQMS